ncbi:MAG: MlaD family protein [Salinivirgaceae bacterium]|jgi:phospholipid/cholesterol/gamma-HCH transport system substrate-binding protein|nr:MlaD family protein [Salinivirgaceae bacterium]
MNNKYKYILIGLLIVITVGIFIFGLNFLKGKNFFIEEEEYYVVYERIEGLNSSSPVLLNGYNIGQVREIKFNDLIEGDLIVKFIVKRDIRIPKNSTARIFSQDLMGTKAIELIFSDSDQQTEIGDTLNSQTEESLKDQVSIEMLPLKNKAEDLLKEMENAIKIINTVFNEETQSNLHEIFRQLTQTAANLNSSSASVDSMLINEKQQIHRLLVNLEGITRNFNSNSKNITELLYNLKSLTDSLNQTDFKGTMSNVDSTLSNLNQVLASIENQQGTMGKLIYDDSLYNTINRGTDEIGNLAADLRINPKRYLHFSVFDLGRTMYVLDEKKIEKKASAQRPIYCVLIDKSDKPIALESFEVAGDVKQRSFDGTYLYTVGEFSKERKAEKFFNKIQKTNPDAQLVKINKNQYEVLSN